MVSASKLIQKLHIYISQTFTLVDIKSVQCCAVFLPLKEHIVLLERTLSLPVLAFPSCWSL